MAALLFAIACKLPAYSDGTGNGRDDTATENSVDADDDGYDASIDCNDRDPSVHPGTKETCGNGQDDNCNGEPDECDWSGVGTLNGTEISGSESNGQFGSELAVCDANGDGQNDLVVAAVGADAYAGAVHVLYGPLDDDGASEHWWTITGSGPDTSMGFSLDCWDMDDDGADELLIGEPNEAGVTAGTVYVVPAGETGVTSIADAFSSAWTGTYPGERLGYGVDALDADGDGLAEIAATSTGAPYEHTAYGITYLVGTLPGMHPAWSGPAYVYGTVDWFLKGTAGNAGDMNSDGIDELALTAHHGIHLGDVVLLFQGELRGALAADDADVEIGHPWSFAAGWTQLGHADLNGDGYDDFLIGNPSDHSSAGAVNVFHGPLDDGTDRDPDATLIGRKDSYTGKAFASPGDLDGDGKAELLIGAPWAGGVYLYRGGETGQLQLDEAAQAAWWRAEDASHCGAALSAGNLTGGLGEFAIGVPLAGDEQEGAVVLLPSFEL